MIRGIKAGTKTRLLCLVVVVYTAGCRISTGTQIRKM